MTIESVQYAVLNFMLYAIFDCLPQHQPNSVQNLNNHLE